MEFDAEIESYHLPRGFWDALMLVRNHLLRDRSFFLFACLHTFDHPLADAFWMVDAWMTKHTTPDDQ